MKCRKCGTENDTEFKFCSNCGTPLFDPQEPELEFGYDPSLPNEAAVQWAEKYGYDSIDGIDDIKRRLLQEKISAFFKSNMTIGDLQESLKPVFGVEMAFEIATTETTRAAVQAELANAAELAESGIKMTPVWHTCNDDEVCSKCKKRNGKKKGDGWREPPPAHIGCRCGIGLTIF